MSTPKSKTSRRAFVGGGLAGFGALALSPLGKLLESELAAAPLGTKRLVVLYLQGGNDGINSVVPVELQAYYDRRPKLAIPKSATLTLDEGPHKTKTYRLHPALVELQKLWKKGNVAFVDKVGYPSPNLSHFFSLDVWSRGSRAPATSGWLARFKDLYAKPSTGVVAVGTRNLLDFQGGKTQSVLIESIARFVQQGDSRYPAHGKLRHELVRELVKGYGGGGSKLRASQTSALGYEMVDRLQQAMASYRSSVVYPNSGVAKKMRDLAVLINAGFDTRVLYTIDGGFDTHANQGGVKGRHNDLLTRVDRALGAFATDLEAMGEWNNTVVAVVSEFGRRNYENGSDGTDHGTANSIWLLGGGVAGGLYGPTLVENDITGRFPEYEIDFRSIYSELIADWLGFDPKPVFPEALAKTSPKLGFIQ